jgi:hypothetical protein
VSLGPVLARLGTTVSPLVQVATSQRSTAEVVEALRDALASVDEVGLVPVFVIDDSDSWFAGPYGSNDEDMISRFFGHTLLLASIIRPHHRQAPVGGAQG